jgi:hypothetical protein
MLGLLNIKLVFMLLNTVCREEKKNRRMKKAKREKGRREMRE